MEDHPCGYAKRYSSILVHSWDGQYMQLTVARNTSAERQYIGFLNIYTYLIYQYELAASDELYDNYEEEVPVILTSEYLRL
jgi:hypothetical protein